MTVIRTIAFASLLALTPLLSVARWVNNQPVSPYNFSLPLIHRDAPNSPLHDPKQSHYEKIRSAVSRSISRAESLLRGVKEDAEAIDIISEGGEYLMNISIGTPRFHIMAMVDTCSDLTWTQCMPYKSRHTQQKSLFDPRKSTTFKPSKRFAHGPISYLDNLDKAMYIRGDWKKEVSYKTICSRDSKIGYDTITLKSFKFGFREFGCKFSKQGTFDSIGSGIFGFGNNRYTVISAKFSYCLTPLSDEGTKSSKIHFGENSTVSSDDDVISTRMIRVHANSYSITLQAFTVGNKRVAWTSDENESDYIIIDLGTPLLMLPSTFYDALESEIRNQVNASLVRDPSNQLKLCYHSDGFEPPELVSNFKGGDVTLNRFNAWLATSNNVLCFAAAPSSIAIYGNLAQRNFLIGYDLQNRKVSFKPANCGE